VAAYWDTSCVLKLYCKENDSVACMVRAGAMAEPIISSVLTVSEMTFALYQKEMRGEIEPGSAHILFEKFETDVQRGRFTLLPFGKDVEAMARRIAAICYSSVPVVPVRTLDALHIASAQLSACREILTTDSRMRSAASLLGLRTPDL
jgi:predicted nucleic acid-binding protein